MEEIGRNMTVVEYGDEIIVIDAGIQFPEAETPGIDFIIPNTEYLEKNKSKIKALVISHGHMDHVGAIPLSYRQTWFSRSYIPQGFLRRLFKKAG